MSGLPVIGFEVHAQLLTRTKIFCGCENRIGGPPNSRVCPVCLGLPGALPVLNTRAVELGVLAALAFDADVASRSTFARKNYFYPDLPKGYQITQHARPLATGGYLDVELDDGTKRVGLMQLHLEEDAGKTTHREGRTSLVDMNRCGVPLLEVVTLPDIGSVEDAVAFAEEARRVLVYCGVTSGHMHEGSLRFDTNISLSGPDGEPGTPCEIKNLNSFRAVRRALEHEIVRQRALLARGERVVHETLLWDEHAGVAVPMRSKEGASDYRYFREPDLPDAVVSKTVLEHSRRRLPDLPSTVRARLRRTHGLPVGDARVLADDAATASYFEETVGALERLDSSRGTAEIDAKACANWIMGPLRGLIHERDLDPARVYASSMPPARLAELVLRRLTGVLNEPAAKHLLEFALDSDEPFEILIERHGLAQISDVAELVRVVASVLAEHPGELTRLRNGERKLVRYLVGQVMARSGERADPRVVHELIEKAAKGENQCE